MIGVTGNAMEEDVLSYEAAGVDLVLAKPVKGEKLTLILQYGEKITKLSQWNRGSSFEVTVRIMDFEGFLLILLFGEL